MATGLRPGGTVRPAEEPPTAAGFGAAPVGLTGTPRTPVATAGFGKLAGNVDDAPNAAELPNVREVTTIKLTLDSI